MIIRKATPRDAEYIATYLLLGMAEIVYHFMGKIDHGKAKEFLIYFAERENNQYSYQNCLVAETNNEILAVLNMYDGGKLHVLREPVIEYIHNHYNSNYTAGDETEPGEYYIDTIGVKPAYQGKGIGTALLNFVMNKYVKEQHQTIGLLVDEDNPKARRLYLKMGFITAGKKTLFGKNLEHLQLKADLCL